LFFGHPVQSSTTTRSQGYVAHQSTDGTGLVLAPVDSAGVESASVRSEFTTTGLNVVGTLEVNGVPVGAALTEIDGGSA
jgi:hypothetical protein